MQIGIVRHFKVNHNTPKGWISAAEYNSWIHSYDEAEIMSMNMANNSWDHCYSSDLSRAIHTARAICQSSLTITALLREIPISPIVNSKLKLPLALWNGLGRLAWFMSHHSQEESKHETERRAEDFIQMLESNEHQKVLVVSHGFFLIVLSNLLRKKGYTGKRTKRFKNGEIIIFRSDDFD
ncbi:histidine phosphatase family protein [Pseudogracilibacillus auburnensis]|uniref:histidine phosphatase family protein n=1 Tax=Pseudogracilibacillus auburnensis TaxID=1494959 RepID=UPI001A95F5BC|nr:histidine phosphatase family protein [Pseudogracilibacillus auburnensis]MBO1005088.1 histidine phosphatase family protein [Pseudogracilibacillus auburnensis]